MPSAPPPILSVTGLSIDARTPQGLRPVLDDVSFSLAAGETLCLAGESGSGKSLTALSIMGLLSPSLRQRAGSIVLAGRELTTLSERAMRQIRGGDVAMIFQEPMTSLNPVMTIGAQLSEAIRTHAAGDETSVAARARAMLDAVHITDPGRRLTQFPHELSGGMRQRVMIAMALSCRPKVLIADEPTTALDVTVQAQILTLMRDLKAEFGTAIVLITHDMGVVAEMADRVALLKNGRMVEDGTVHDIFERPRHDYTKSLLAAVLRLGSRAGQEGPPRITHAAPTTLGAEPVLFVRDLTVSYGGRAGWFGKAAPVAPAVKAASFSVRPGQTLGLVGESGSGKSTTGKAVLGLIPFTGEVVVDGKGIAGLSSRDMKPVRRKAQMIFQDPYASLDPRMSIGDAIAEPLVIHDLGTARERRDHVAALLKRVHLSPDHATRFPHEFSGGQRQRICIARALALKPNIIVADESVSALDVSVRGHVLDLMLELQEELGLAYLFISHDMAVVERMSHQVAVMRYGEIVEQGDRRAVFENPHHPYTQALLDAVPQPTPRSRATVATPPVAQRA
ncbi:ABC transporter ATP-binding protein [Lichenihabitans sp. PAMC28606]|uniref:ABC transporter ATP-binding protein n=1 Tax=Lichenihabitans sp. PAMC28606 TaxID=2880932 RepID=UPI001D0BAEDF|nr:ABC transporter ATP-binding protein [Lichenihabitans sp. PAMC28606]UDL96731.1 ABC transporter ATP-binding protein [Lichenihabitans sp. PAMC28606]